jgi:crotonobetainyl-CoA:carnitine CoA-transferase CaiB-like acyl-CoA transferase
MAACGVLAGLYARRRRGGGQTVSASLLGAALTPSSPAPSSPVIASSAARCSTRTRPATAPPTASTRPPTAPGSPSPCPTRAPGDRLRAVAWLPGLPNSPPALRTDRTDSQPEELLLESAFRTRDGAAWVAELRAAGVPVEPVATPDRTGFAAGFTDDPVNRQLGRVVSYHWGARGPVDQPRFPPELGPGPRPRAMAGIPGLGEHTAEFLDTLGLTTATHDHRD